MFQLLSDSLQTGIRFLQPPLPAIPTTHLTIRLPPLRRDVGFGVFRSSDKGDVVPASTPTVLMSVCSKAEVEQPTAYRLA